jgi:hypothetical protein
MRNPLRRRSTMQRAITVGSVLLAVVVLAMPFATSAPESIFPADAGAIVSKMGPDGRIEMGFAKDGAMEDVEFHVPYGDLPAPIREKLDALLPGGEVLDAEVEYSPSGQQFEVTKKIDGKEAEVLVDARGEVVSWELQVDEAAVPEAVRKAAGSATGGTVTQYEEIRDGAKALIAYHVKKDEGGIRWKIEIAPDGTVRYVRREVVAEIEVTVR